MIVDDSLTRLTTRMIVHNSFWSSVFPENRQARLKWPPITSRGTTLLSFSNSCLYIQDDNNDKENSEDQDNIE